MEWTTASTVLPQNNSTGRVSYVYRYYLGIVIILLSSLFIMLQMFYLKMISGKGGWRSEFSLTLLFILGITDLSQLFAHFLSGIFLLFDRDAPSWCWIPGAFLTAGWNSMVILLCFLTLHRFIWLVFPFNADRILSERVLKIMLTAFFTYVAFHIICHLTWISPIYFKSQRFIWGYDPNGPLRQFFLSINSITNYAIVLFNFPLYLIIFTTMYIRRKKVSRVKVHEIRITFQIFSFLVFGIICIVMWEKKYDRIKHPIRAFFGGLLFWICWNGMKAVSSFFFYAYSRLRMRRFGGKKTFSGGKAELPETSRLNPPTPNTVRTELRLSVVPAEV